MAARKSDPLLERALMESDLQLGSQGTALRGLLSQLGAEYTRTRKVNASNARAIAGSAQAAAPQVTSAYDQALSSVNAQRAALGAGGAADPQAAAYTRRVGESKANALVDLVGQATRAQAGQVYGGQVARDEYLGKKADVTGQLVDLAHKQGLTAQSIYDKLRDDQAQRGLTRRGQTLSHQDRQDALTTSDARLTETQRHNRAIEATSGPNAKKPWATPAAHASARDAITGAASHVPDLLKDTQGSRAQVIQLLIDGVPAVKSADGKTTLAEAIKPVSPDFARAAVNAAVDKSLSKGDVKRLHNRGLKVKALGIPVRKPRKVTLGEALQGLSTAVQSIPPVTVG